MKKLTIITMVFLFVFISNSLFAQSPNQFSYQAVVRDANNQILTNQNVGIRLSILKTTATGSISYSESHTVSTNQYGLVNLSVGNGTLISGDFSTINWGNDLYFLKVDIDITGGSTYLFMGTTQLLSVPYALHAGTADSVVGPINENDPIFGASVANAINQTDTANWNSKLDSYTEADPIFGASVASTITQTDTVYWSNKLDAEIDGSVTNELQALSFSNDTLYLSDGNQVYMGDIQNIWTKQGNNVFTIGNKIGIGTDAPTTSLHIKDTTFFGGPNGLLNLHGGAESSIMFQTDSIGTDQTKIFLENQNNTLNIRHGGASRLYFFENGNMSLNSSYSGAAKFHVYEGNTSDTTTGIDAHSLGGVSIRGNTTAQTNLDYKNIGVEGHVYTLTGTSGRGLSANLYGMGNGGYGIFSEAHTALGSNTGIAAFARSQTGNTNWHIGGEFTARGDWDPANGVGTGSHYGIRALAIGGGSYNCGIRGQAQGNNSTADNRGGDFRAFNDVPTSGWNIGVLTRADSSSYVNRGIEAHAISNIGQWNYAGIFFAKGTGHPTSSTSNLGVYGTAENNKQTNIGVQGVAKGGANPGAWITGVFGYANGYGGSSGYGVDGSNVAKNKKNVGVGGFAYGDVSGDSVNMAFYGYVANADTNYAMYADAIYNGQVNYGIYAEAANGTVNNHAGFFEGNVTVTGNLNVVGSISKGSGTFKIDHPTDPENKYLVHSFVESPDMMNVYSGNIITDANGLATVVLPDYFSAANKDFRYQLTCIGVFAQAIVKDKINGNTFIVQTDKPNVEISWQVTAVRNDKYAQQNRITPVQDKPESEQGKYLHPELYGKSVSSRVYTKHHSGGAEMMETKRENEKKSEEAAAMSPTKNDDQEEDKERTSTRTNSNSTTKNDVQEESKERASAGTNSNSTTQRTR